MLEEGSKQALVYFFLWKSITLWYIVCIACALYIVLGYV